MAAQLFPRSARKTPRFTERNTFRAGEGPPVLPLADLAESSPSISSGVGLVGSGISASGSAHGCVKGAAKSGVSTAPSDGTQSGDPVHAMARAPAADPASNSQEVSISCTTRVAVELGGYAVSHVLAAPAIYAPATILGLQSDPAPPVPNMWTAAAETSTIFQTASRHRSCPARRHAAPTRPVRGVRDGAPTKLQELY